MSSQLKISFKPKQETHINLSLPLSKSESNRGIAILYFGQELELINKIEWSDSTDTQLLLNFIQTKTDFFNFEDAGTPLRFALGLQSINTEFRTITGNKRLQERPIGDLLDTLKSIGAEIDFLEAPNQIPLRIKGPLNPNQIVEISGKQSSQHVSALMILLATKFPETVLRIKDQLVSPSYVDLTVNTLKNFGFEVERFNREYKFRKEQKINITNFKVYGDWSAAGYFYLMQLMLPHVKITLTNLSLDSAQGDIITWKLFQKLGVETTFTGDEANLVKATNKSISFDEDFHSHPDLVPTFVSACAYLGIDAIFRNIEILRQKESDRISALNSNLVQLGFELKEIETGTFKLDKTKTQNLHLNIKTHKDHRIAMAFAPWAVYLGSISIDNPNCVSKSFPKFWKEMRKCGVELG